jgi:hypothetical protein
MPRIFGETIKVQDRVGKYHKLRLLLHSSIGPAFFWPGIEEANSPVRDLKEGAFKPRRRRVSVKNYLYKVLF